MRFALAALLLTGMSGPALPAAAMAAQAAPAVCGNIPPDADAESFASAAEARALAQTTAANFAVAASRLCQTRALRAADLAPFSRLVVRRTEGTADPTVYDDAEQGPGSLIVEYGFAGGTAPGAPALETAIRCWREPTRAGCDQATD